MGHERFCFLVAFIPGDSIKTPLEGAAAGNERRLTGRHETASIERFSYGVANRGASVRRAGRAASV